MFSLLRHSTDLLGRVEQQLQYQHLGQLRRFLVHLDPLRETSTCNSAAGKVGDLDSLGLLGGLSCQSARSLTVVV